MKKTVVTLFTILFIFCGWLPAQNVQVVENSFQGVTLRYSAGQFAATNVSTDKGDFSRLTMEGSHLSSEVGQPQLPVVVNLLEIPICEGVSYTVRQSNYRDVSAADLGMQHPLFPAQPSYSKSYSGTIELVKDEVTYRTNQFYSRDLITVETTGTLRNIRVATVSFSPIQYNPVTNTYRIYENIEVAISYENADIPATYEMKSLHGNAIFNGLQSQVINPLAAPDREATFNRPIKYQIVANSMFRGQLDEFVAWKKRQGFEVEIAYTDEAAVGTTTTSIAAFLKAKYTNATADNPAPTFVLLVGDVQQIPVFTTRVSGKNHKTDLYYFTWTNGDNIPDCYYGRFSVQNATQLSTILEKTFQYEQYTMPDPNYLDEAVLVAGSDSYWSQTHANGQMNYLSNNYVNTAYGFSNVHLYLYNSSSLAAQIRSDIGQGAGYVNYTAHCDENGWQDPEFNTSHISSLSNANKYSFMIGNCCLSNKFDENNCFGEAIVRADKKGAVAYVGGSNSTLWDEDFYWSVGVRANINANTTYDAAHLGAYDRLFHTHGEAFNEWCITGSSLIYGGNLSVEASTSSNKLYYWEIYHLMGDPSILPWLSQPEPMSVIVPNAVVNGTTTLQVTAVPYAYIALTCNGEVIAATTADVNGIANLTFAPLTFNNTYEIAVTAQNYQPYFHSLTLITPDNAYVVATNARLSANQEPNYNAAVSLDVTLENLGVQTANNITTTLATTSPHITITNATTNLASLAANGTQDVANAFAFTIAEDVADNTTATFTLTTTFNGSESTVTNFNLRLLAPQLRNSLTQTIETEGNNDGVIQPGETCLLRITTTNAGQAPAVGTYSHLRCAYNLVTIVNDNLNLGDIAAGGNNESEFTIQIGSEVPNPFIIPFIHDIYAGAYSFTDTIYLFVGESLEDFETGNLSKFAWVNGSKPWSVSTTNPYEGTYCAVSKSGLNYGNTSTLTLSVTAAQNDSISFYRCATIGSSSYFGNDEFTFYIDGQPQEVITSNTSWGRAAFPISAGTHTIKFEYACNLYYGNAGTAAIDFIRFPLDAEIAPMNINSFETNPLHIYPNPASEWVTIELPTNTSSYALALFDLNGNRLATRTIQGSQSYQLSVNGLAAGVYLITLFNDEGVYTGKIVKK